MGNILVVAEKPSVAQSLAKVLGAYKRNDGFLEGNGYIVSWCFGHLAEYAMPDAYDERYGKWRFEDLPIIPGQWKLQVAKGKEKQVGILTKLLQGEMPVGGGEDSSSLPLVASLGMTQRGITDDSLGMTNNGDTGRKIDYVVNACDAGREGELIFRHMYEVAGATIPIKRLWISSMEEEAIREGFENLKDGKAYENLYAAAVCRAKADWLVGMNATRGFSTMYGSRITVGRVQSPTLAMIVERQLSITNFKKEPYFKDTIKGSGIAAVSESISDEALADELVGKCEGQPATITRVEKEQKRENPPKLYDLTSLQRDANRFFGYTAQQTLDTLQELYEEKLVTYPRTDSRYITSDMEKSVGDLLETLAAGFSVAGKAEERNVQRLICDSKVSDHHALLPTMSSMDFDIKQLNEKKRNIYLMVATRLASAAAGAKHMEKTYVEVTCAGDLFTANATVVTVPGFQAVEDAFAAGYVRPEKQDGGNEDISVVTILDELFEGKEIENPMIEKSKHFTQPPKPYTEDTLLAAMERAGAKEMDDDVERKGLGTPATRAGVIEKLVAIGYIGRKGKQILPTDRGIQVAGVLPDKLKSAELTAEWENLLLGVERGNAGAEEFLGNIFGQIDEVLEGLVDLSVEERSVFASAEAIGKCPVCGSPVIEGKGNYHCSNRECKFVLWQDNRYLASMKGKIDRNAAIALLNDGKAHMKGLYSQKKGKSFDANLVLGVDDLGRARFSLEFPKKRKK